MTKRLPSAAIPPRSSLNPDRRSLHLNLTAVEYDLIAERAAIADLSRPRYTREAALAVQIYRTTNAAEVFVHTAAAIACVGALARSPAVRLHFPTWRHLEAAMAELHGTSAQLEQHIEELAKALALLPPNPPRSSTIVRPLPGPGSAIWTPSA